VAVAPRLIGNAVYNGIVPLGGEFWNSTTLSFGADMPTQWLNIITGERLESTPSGSNAALSLSRVFSHFPVALLYHEQLSALSSVHEEQLHVAGVQHGTT